MHKLSDLIAPAQLSPEELAVLKGELYRAYGKYYMLHRAYITVQQLDGILQRVRITLTAMQHPVQLPEGEDSQMVLLDVSW